MDFTQGSTIVVRKSMMTVKPKDLETEQLVRDYIANGGMITHCKTGARAIKITNEIENAAWTKPKKKPRKK